MGESLGEWVYGGRMIGRLRKVKEVSARRAAGVNICVCFKVRLTQLSFLADYKNNILKEKFALSREKVELLREIPPKNLDRGMAGLQSLKASGVFICFLNFKDILVMNQKFSNPSAILE